MDPCSRKGEIRARTAEQLFDVYRRGDVLATSGRAMAVVMPLMRELDEMLDQWEEPFVVDDRRFRGRFQRCQKMWTLPLPSPWNGRCNIATGHAFVLS